MKKPKRIDQNENPEMVLAWLLRDINQMAQSQMSQNLARYGLYVGQPRILRLIQVYPGETQKQIADRLFVSGASLSTSLKRLQKAGLVEQRQSEQDRRRHELYLTPAGVDACRQCRADLDDLYRYMLTGLDEQATRQLLDGLRAIHDNLTARQDENKEER